MEKALSALKGLLWHDVVIVFILLAVIGFLVFFSGKSEKKRKKAKWSIIACVLLLILHAVLGIPVITDAVNDNIVVENGVYTNLIGGRNTDLSDQLGIYSVTLVTEDGKLNLTTAPFCNGVFVRGTYHVVAYYLPTAEVLLHIEILAGEMTGDGSVS